MNEPIPLKVYSSPFRQIESQFVKAMEDIVAQREAAGEQCVGLFTDD